MNTRPIRYRKPPTLSILVDLLQMQEDAHALSVTVAKDLHTGSRALRETRALLETMRAGRGTFPPLTRTNVSDRAQPARMISTGLRVDHGHQDANAY